MGTDTIFGRPVFLTRTSPSACQPLETDWASLLPEKRGQTRSLNDRTLDPVDLSRPRSDGPSRLERPDMGTDTKFDRTFGTVDLAERPVVGQGRLRRADMGTDTMSDMPMRNVQRETFNSQLLTG